MRFAVQRLSVLCLVLAACGDNPKPSTVGGTVSGLAGSGLVVSINGIQLPISANGAFAFTGTIPSGKTYTVAVAMQPVSPAQTCVVTNGTGTTAGKDITDVAINCTTNQLTVGGMITGLQGTGLVLQDNGGDDLAVSADGSFMFATPLASGTAFTVTVKDQPSNPTQTCTVSGGTGTVGNGAVTTVVVNCAVDRFTVGGTVTGLAGSLVLQNNGGDDITLTADGTFAFPTTIASGAAYAVTVLAQPSTPSQTCVITNDTGTVTSANVTSVSITCTTNSFKIGGTVSGLSGTGLVLQDNGGDDLTIAADGTFQFTTPVLSGTTFSVTVLTQPTTLSQTCTVTGGSGTVGGADVSSVMVDCTTDRFTISGTISGLDGTVVLQNNGTNDLSVTSNGTFSFTTTVASGDPYAVTVLTNPTTPWQTCVVTSDTGTVTDANITDVVVTCSTNPYTIGGTVTGLASGDSVTLRQNGGDDLTVSANNGFTFTTPVLSGATYSVTVATNPSSPVSQSCAVTNASGTVAGANITNVVVTCTTNTFTIGGSVTGATGPLVLENNLGNDLTVNANGTFTFTTAIASGATYSVTVKTPPSGQACAVTNGTGTVGSANVTNVAIRCYVPSDCANNPLWTPVTCTTSYWVWSTNETVATDVTTASTDHVLATGCQHYSIDNHCSLTGAGWVSTQTFIMSGCDTSWYHLSDSFTTQCGGHDGDVVRHLAMGPNDCYNY
jgi:large repetitive protein